MSIRYHLMLRLFIASFIVVGGSIWFGYRDVQHETTELFDAQLARSARLILSMVQADKGHSDFSSIQHYLDENRPDNEPQDHTNENIHELESGHVYETKLAFQIWDNLGNLILKSENAPIQPMTDKKSGFTNHTFLNYQWRVFSVISHDHYYQCVTAERVDVRNDLIEKISSNLFLMFIILIPLLSVVMWFAIKHGLSPLHNLADQISRRDASKLDAVSETNVPGEIQTIAGALNNLLTHLTSALAREKRITSDAAHELRTPLAAVRIHAELALKVQDDRQRVDALNNVLQGIDRTAHLVDQLLALAKLEPESFAENMESVDLKEIVIEETALLAPIAHQKNIEIAVNECKNFKIKADSTSLRLLIRNLLSNAICYTQNDGRVTIDITATPESVKLIIEDNGPGIPADQRDRVFERFYRIKNNENTGCGIGLSIVAHVAKLHKATLLMSQPEKGTGLIVTVSFTRN